MDEKETSGGVPSGSDAPTIQPVAGQLRPGDRVVHYKIL